MTGPDVAPKTLPTTYFAGALIFLASFVVVYVSHMMLPGPPPCTITVPAQQAGIEAAVIRAANEGTIICVEPGLITWEGDKR